jgi:nucleoside-diphosphate-sugar epimerase
VTQVEKARRSLGFEATVDLEEGIARTAEWYRKSGAIS